MARTIGGKGLAGKGGKSVAGKTRPAGAGKSPRKTAPGRGSKRASGDATENTVQDNSAASKKMRRPMFKSMLKMKRLQENTDPVLTRRGMRDMIKEIMHAVSREEGVQVERIAKGVVDAERVHVEDQQGGTLKKAGQLAKRTNIRAPTSKGWGSQRFVAKAKENLDAKDRKTLAEREFVRSYLAVSDAPKLLSRHYAAVVEVLGGKTARTDDEMRLEAQLVK